MADRSLDILIVGGGIAGCCAAIALTECGHRVRIVEKQIAWRFQSSGIFVYANGLVELDKLGLLDAVLNAGFPVPGGRNSYFDHTGQPIVETVYPSPDLERIPAILGIKRSELHRAMAARVAALGVPVQLGTTVQEIDQSGDGVSVDFSDGTRASFDLLIGADGVRSPTREMIRISTAPRYTGFGVWRSVHLRPPELSGKIMMMGPAKRFGIMPISDDLLYTFGTVPARKSTRYDPASWARTMRETFAEFRTPAAQFLEELSATTEILYTAVEEVEPPPPWHRNRVVLIGDAAHASTPFMGQGGAMAMQDAVALRKAINAKPSLVSALHAFSAARYPVCKFVQKVSRAVGEAGAQEQDYDPKARNADLRRNAQCRVDAFYQELAELNANAELLLEQER